MEKNISEEEIDFIARNTVASLRFEGMETPPEEIEELKEMLRGNISYEECLKRILKQP